jgi:hypothetical protein
MAEDTIKIQVELEKDNKSFAKIEKEAKESGERTASEFATGFIGGAAAKAAVLASAVIGALFSKKSIEAAIESEKAVTAFNRALARTGEFSQLATESFQRFATEVQLSTGIADEAVLDVATKIQNLGSLTTSELTRATEATLNLSSALGIDLDSAATLVGKSATGNISAFNRLGIEIQKGKTDAETFANTLAILESRFSGASAGALNTFSGSLLSLSNGFGDILEEIGKFITQSPALVAVVREFGKIFVSISESISKAREGTTIVNDFVIASLGLARVLNDLVVRPLEIVFNVVKAIFKGAQAQVQLFVAVLATFADAAGEVLGFLGLIKKETVGLLESFRQDSFSIFEQFTNDFTKSLSFDSLFSQDGSTAIDQFLLKLKTAAEEAGPIAETLKNNVQKPLQEVSQLIINIGNIVQQGLVSAISAGVQRLGAALVQGSAAFSDFGKAVFGILGDILINVGTAIIATSQAVEALRLTLTTLFGGFGIVAGLALIAFGGALKAIGGGGLASAATGQSGATPVSTTQPSDDFSPDSLVGQSSRVTVNIQGDVLDSRDTGLRIVELIQDAFDTDGAKVVTA